jgi:hypothetical protein
MFAKRPLPTMRRVRVLVPMLVPMLAITLGVLAGRPVQAQIGGFGGQAVGGISIDTDGIVRNLEPRALESLAAERTRALADAAWNGTAGRMRKVSLHAVMQAVRQGVEKGTPLPVEVVFLGGLQRIEYLFVDPDRHDIVLCGPADALAVDAAGAVVGATTRRPPLQLEDLVVALRAIDAARAGGVTCSIDPTPEGITALQTMLRRMGAMGPDPATTFARMEEALGPQRVTVQGVPGDSRFARVLVAADYRMKRIGMGLEPSGLRELPSYLDMVPAGGRPSSLPRFWLEADYDPIERDPDELAWHLRGRRMKCLTESDVAGRNGVRRAAAPADAIARSWCDAMAANYDTLAAKQPIFAELTNCIDLAVVAAVIHGRQLDKRAGCDLGALVDPAALPLPHYEVPTTVPTVATGVKKGTTWVVSASGGVSFQPWQFASQATDSSDVAASRTDALASRPAASVCSWD